MMMIQLKVDIITELKNLVPSSYMLIVPEVVLNELKLLKHKGKGKNKLSASIAYKIAQEEPFIIKSMKKTEHVDNMLLNYCTNEDILCTNDKNLRQRARKKGITVIYLRQHRYLEVDGHIKY